MNRIALVMIARDEARCIERSLASARASVDQLLVLDTGSRDDTAAIARRCGARVAHFRWCDDFAAARNAALDLADADWCLVLDADEWLVAGADALHALQSLRRGPADFIGQVRVDSAFDGRGGGGNEAQHAPSWLPRLLPRGVRYAGRVHEQPQSALPRQRLSLVIGHDGYLADHLVAKRGRNERLLRLGLQSTPDDAYLHYQLGKDLDVQQRWPEAVPHYLQADALADPRAGWRHDLVVRLVHALKRSARYEEAVQYAEREMPHWQHSPDFFFTLGDLLLDWAAGEPQRAPELLEMIESSWLRAVEIGEQPALQDSVRGRGSFLAAHNLAVFHESLGNAPQAQFWRGRERVLRGGA